MSGTYHTDRVREQISIQIISKLIKWLTHLNFKSLCNLPEFEFVGFFSESGTRGQLDHFTKKDIHNSIAKLFKYYGNWAFAYAKCVCNDTVVILVFIFRGQQGQGNSHTLLKWHMGSQVGIPFGQCGSQSAAKVVEGSFTDVELFLELGLWKSWNLSLPKPEQKLQEWAHRRKR